MKKKLKKKSLLLVIVVLTILIATSIMFIKSSNNRKILGEWVTPGGTIYEFQKNNVGVMKASSKEFKFKYKINKKELVIDYEDEKAFDPTYEYKISKNKLVVKGTNGTFTLTKK